MKSKQLPSIGLWGIRVYALLHLKCELFHQCNNRIEKYVKNIIPGSAVVMVGTKMKANNCHL